MICPRCDSGEARTIFEAPENGVWQVYRCPRCFMVWRSTEEERVTNPALYDRRFKLNEEKIRSMDPKPPIPPLAKD
jgi:uncharacterized C2H2 Zn-finger protein